ncbi:hypothetical protein FUA23_06070 [Neolewinella aurantiaca]|uniref:DUF2004 domain-containing protein n=1 Tax=Neolewinella aurantiaca TaxID=2602767 RepID=A0A5C7FVK8_9BACT|nr:hypothetical protein [Neolewinella aurantiaca]TXF90659.1 hypothetical protein FUA23_06070 [Neolewinella aurantiaca]
MGILKDAGDSFEGEKEVESVQLSVGFHLPKVITPQRQKQIEFFKDFDENYSIFRELFTAAIKREMELENEVDDFDQDYKLKFMALPTCVKEPFEWEITYYENKNFHHWFTFSIRGNEVLHVTMDG